jgi:hypothetical protein
MQQQSQENTTLDFLSYLVGMNDDVKQFDKLISAFAKSNLLTKT